MTRAHKADKTRSRKQSRGNGGEGYFSIIPDEVWTSPAMRLLEKHCPRAIAVLGLVASQYRPPNHTTGNNGALVISEDLWNELGINSRETRTSARLFLVQLGFLERTTRPSKLHAATYALGWRSIDPCGDLDLLERAPPKRYLRIAELTPKLRELRERRELRRQKTRDRQVGPNVDRRISPRESIKTDLSVPVNWKS